MDSEIQIIKRILRNFSTSKLHRNEFFQSDSEIIDLEGNEFLITVDSYSSEDNFNENNPFILGRNLVACTMSDIFACGGRPLLFCNSLTKGLEWSENYIDLFSKGISSVLQSCETGFIGGDIGTSSCWSFTGIVIGKAVRPVKRIGAKPGDHIYITGTVGNGNYEAATQVFDHEPKLKRIFDEKQIEFPIRQKESQLVSGFATSCIDTSDGLLRSLNIVSEMNGTGYIISEIPYSEPGLIMASAMKLPQEIMMFGESGEYELLFTIDQEEELELINRAKEIGSKIFKIGQITNSGHKLIREGIEFEIGDFNIWARDYSDINIYISSLINYLTNKFTLKS